MILLILESCHVYDRFHSDVISQQYPLTNQMYQTTVYAQIPFKAILLVHTYSMENLDQ